MSLLHRAVGAGTATALVGAALLAAPGAIAAPVVPAAADHDHHHGHVAEAYTLELLAPTNGGATASALGINDRGDVVGITRPTTSAQPQRTVLWERHGDHFHAHELANLEGSQFSRGFDLNDDQAIVGEAFNAGGNSIPVRWDGDAAPQHVTTLNEAGTGILNDIADDGVAVGTASGAGVRVAASGTVSVLPAPAHSDAGAVVNNYSATTVAEGDVIGGRTSIAVPHGDHAHNELFGVVWEGGTPRLLTTPADGSAPVVASVTPDAEAVGSATVDGKETAVLWAADGTPELLALPGVEDYAHTAAKAAYDDVVVGYTSKFAGNTSFGAAAIAWDAHGPVDLNTRVVDLPEGVVLQTANDINESGQIVGTTAKTETEGARGFVLTPVAEEPSFGFSALSAHYHQGATITATLVADPELADGDTVDWEWRWPGQGWTPLPGAQGLSHSLAAEHALDGVELRATLTFADPAAEPVVAEPVSIHVDDHGAAPLQQTAVTGTTSHAEGDPVSLTAEVSPSTVLDTFRWERKASGAADFAVIDGASGTSLTFPAALAENGAQYRVAVVKPNGDAAYGPSAPVTLAVTASPVGESPEPQPQPGPAVTLTPTVEVAPVAKVRRGKAAVVRVKVRAGSAPAAGHLIVSLAGKDRLVTLSGGEATVRVKVATTTKPGKRKLVVRYVGAVGIDSAKQVRKVRIVR